MIFCQQKSVKLSYEVDVSVFDSCFRMCFCLVCPVYCMPIEMCRVYFGLCVFMLTVYTVLLLLYAVIPLKYVGFFELI